MDGLSSDGDKSLAKVHESLEFEQVRALLRNAAKDHKVTFGAYRGVFDLKRSDLENFFYLLNQRVEEQNGCKPLACEAAVYYDNGTSRRFPSIADFNQYSETTKRHPTIATLHVAYLIKFPDSEIPEKQEIDIEIRSSELTSETVSVTQTDQFVRGSSDKIHMDVGEKVRSNLGIIKYTINHTRTTWGLDLENHIRGHVERLLEEPSPKDRIISAVAGPLNLFTTVFVGLACVNLIIDGFFNFLYSTDGAASDSEILSVAAEYLVNGHIAKYIVASLVVSAVFFVFFSAFVSALTSSLKKPKPSFICLDAGDEKRRDTRLRQHEKRWSRLAATIVLNLAVATLMIFWEDRVHTVVGQFFDASKPHLTEEPEIQTNTPDDPIK